MVGRFGAKSSDFQNTHHYFYEKLVSKLEKYEIYILFSSENPLKIPIFSWKVMFPRKNGGEYLGKLLNLQQQGGETIVCVSQNQKEPLLKKQRFF